MPSTKPKTKKKPVVVESDESGEEPEDPMDLCFQPTVGRVDANIEAARCADADLKEDGEPQNLLKFNNYKACFEVSHVIYCDFESYISDEKEHIPSGYCCYTVSKFENNVPVVYSGNDVMEKFFDHLDSERTRIKNLLDINVMMSPLSREEQVQFNNSTVCVSCERNYSASNSKVRHHCHVTGKYINAVCNSCNLALKPRSNGRDYFIPVIFHNLKGYDSHHVLKHLTKRFAVDGVEVIASNTEKFIAFRVGMLRFVDSLAFLNASLDKLVENLKLSGTEQFVHTRKYFGDNANLMLRKGIYPYEYISFMSKLDEGQLPPQSEFYSSLTKMGVSDVDYEHAKAVWSAFNMTTLRDYHNTYVTSDVLLLADVFQSFRRHSMNVYGLDPVHFYTTPGLSFSACLRLTQVRLDLLTDIDHLLLVERGLRGGVSVISSRESAANNCYIEGYDPSKPSSFITYLDANNLYGWPWGSRYPSVISGG
jgi:hypothetical protein